MSVIDRWPDIRRIDPALADRFRADLEKLGAGDGKLGLAVSGGPDSMAMLLLAHEAMPDRVEAATIDHQLRAESADEAIFAAKISIRLGIPHEIIPVKVAKGNIQANAREARYSALASWMSHRKLRGLVTAHHADDQAETLLMRLNRGSGLSGLAGVRAHSWFFPADLTGEYELFRPLLDWRKRELEKIVSEAGINPVQDQSNDDASFDRVRIRKALAQQDWLDPVAIAKSAGLLGETFHDVQRELARRRRESVVEQDDGFVFHWGHGSSFDVEMVRWIIEQMGGDPRRSQIAEMIARLRRKKNASLAGVLARPIMFQVAPDYTRAAWKFEREPLRKT